MYIFFFSSRRRHTRYIGDWSSDVCSSDLGCPNPGKASQNRAKRKHKAGGRIGVTRTAERVYIDRHCGLLIAFPSSTSVRSEERRVGKECRYRWWVYHAIKRET